MLQIQRREQRQVQVHLHPKSHPQVRNLSLEECHLLTVCLATSTTPLSSCPADTKLEGVNYLKGQAPVLALPDDQYPEWLWTILKPKVYADDGPGGKADRVKRRAEKKQRIKDRNFMSTQ